MRAGAGSIATPAPIADTWPVAYILYINCTLQYRALFTHELARSNKYREQQHITSRLKGTREH